MRVPLVNLREQRSRSQHPGLILTRYLAEQNDEGRDKRALFEAACTCGRNSTLVGLYRRAFGHWRQSTQEDAIKAEVDLQTLPFTRLIVGLGNKGVIEAGLRLHHTYGVPLIPGSALKGLTSHYCHDVYGPADERYRRGKEYHKLLFGTTDDSGVVRFEDAWMHPDSLSDRGMFVDVMTPHHQNWQSDEQVAPTDFDSPVPVPFLSVAGRFHLVVGWQGPDHPQAEAWTKRALDLLKAALAEWGVGGKTSSGYGRLIESRTTPSEAPSRPAAPAGKRDHGTRVTVTILAKRSGGFDVQEAGRQAGVLNQGKPPATLPEINATVEVFVFNDDPRKPQYRWDRPSAPPPSRRPGKPPRR